MGYLLLYSILFLSIDILTWFSEFLSEVASYGEPSIFTRQDKRYREQEGGLLDLFCDKEFFDASGVLSPTEIAL